MPELVQNPLNFATNYETYRGSVNAGDDNDSWGGVSGKKALYDPCPAGWKVPPAKVGTVNSWGSYTAVDNSEWTFKDYIGMNKGAVFNGVNGTANLGHFYPASGCRANMMGGMTVAGTAGHYWSGSPRDIYSYSLIVRSNEANPSYDILRTGGYAVRCVAE